jgi:hypothetical protein
MLDTNIILALALLLGSMGSSSTPGSIKEPPGKPPVAGGIPIPPRTTGAGNFQ